MSADRENIIVGYAEPPGSGDDCGCCEGLSVETPQRLFNRAGLSAVAYRVGTHSRFKEAMQARLSAVKYPALADLRTRDDDDFSIALLDAWATVCDVLTFYQERIANESYLRSANERLSVFELARLLGYRPLPGVAASTYLAFSLQEAPGAPEQALRKTTIPKGTRVNSVPGPGETQQTFEIIEDIEARVEWNALKPLMTAPQRPIKTRTSTSLDEASRPSLLKKNSRSAYLKGTDINLKKGDAILFVGKEREESDASDQWDLRFFTKVEPDHAVGHTYIEWASDGDAEKLRSVGEEAEAQDPKVYALRIRASLFGHNAIDPKLLHPKIWEQFDTKTFKNDNPPNEWKFLINKEEEMVCLDSDYPSLMKDSWLVLARRRSPAPPTHHRCLFRVESHSSETISKYGLSTKATCVSVKGPIDKLSDFEKSNYRKTSIFTASEELAFADAPLNEPIGIDPTDPIILNSVVEGLESHRLVFVRGKRARVRVVKSLSDWLSKKLIVSKVTKSQAADFVDAKFDFETDDKKLLHSKLTNTPIPSIGTVLTVLGKPSEATSPAGIIRTWRLREEDGTEHVIQEGHDPFEFIAAADDDETIVEAAYVKSLVREGSHSKLTFESPLATVFDRGSMEILANIAPATHGETVSEILGSGDASVAFQRFPLSGKPLTYVSGPTPSGAESTLEVRVGGVRWEEVPTLLGRGPQERVYTTHMDAEGNVTVEFGDGRTGARLSTGQNNVQASYRKGIGLPGNVGAEQLSLLMDRPLGVQGAVNPMAASGGDDPESADHARQNAPLGVLTLERAVSLTDYEDFARGFAGVAKALATWSWDGGRRRVFITIAGPEGNAIPEGSKTYHNLVGALKASRDPFVQFTVASYRLALFQLKLSVTASADYLPETVRGQIELALRSAFGFAARSLGQPVHRSEVIEVVHGVAGVVAVDVLAFHRTTPPRHNKHKVYPRLPAARPMLASTGELAAAELLLLDPGPLEERLEIHQ